MTPTTLLLHDETGAFIRLVSEEETGHNRLLSCALKGRGQVGYAFAEEVTELLGSTKVRIFTKTLPTEEENSLGW